MNRANQRSEKMRSKEEIELMLGECITKRDYWWNQIKSLKEPQYPEQLEQYEDQKTAWDERVKTLQYVLGINEVI